MRGNTPAWPAILLQCLSMTNPEVGCTFSQPFNPSFGTEREAMDERLRQIELAMRRVLQVESDRGAAERAIAREIPDGHVGGLSVTYGNTRCAQMVVRLVGDTVSRRVSVNVSAHEFQRN